MHKILLIGASGLIGNKCLEELLKDDYFSIIEIWVRKPIGISHPKLKEVLVNFEELNSQTITDSPCVFCCLGTTIKTAKTKEAFRRVDFDYVVEMAKLSEKSNVEKMLIISSIGANPKTKNFYLKTKGEMEETVKLCKIPALYILRPSILLGKRKEFRLGELIGKFMMRLFKYFMLGKMKKYRGIEAATIAKIMIEIAKGNETGIHVLESNKIAEFK